MNGTALSNVYLAKQKIFNSQGKAFAYELLFRDHPAGIKEFPSNIQATSQVLLNTLTNININELLGSGGVAFINVDEYTLTSGIIDLLDKDRFILEILETTDLNEDVLAKIKQYHKRGFKIAIDDFDCSAVMIKKFTPILKYTHFLKVDVITSQQENLKNIITKIKELGIKILAEKIESEEEYKYYKEIGFDLFQGYHLHRPEVVEMNRYKDATQIIILHLLKLIKNDAQTYEIESYIKQRADLSYKLIKFINNHGHFDTRIESITQIITLLGRDKLLRWLLLYLYAEVSDNPISESIMHIAILRAERMEENAHHSDKDKAYLAGMLSMLGALFETDIKDVIKDIKMDKDIVDLVVAKKGKFLSSFNKAEHAERTYLKQLLCHNFDKIDTTVLLYALELSHIPIDPDKL
ncbi:EAL and HDOD domain-containing protein [Sulfuricurvum sp.]|uniref:EAL and HDOD domain-containing protein n=1 Tax=Sulfuricurvum sp. TaxID=2025608 RepID=UPI002E339F99|nr:EAL domain-containing protein [Sulfuricurvum sp.]HEX5329486.1 EAL domain-containing protein [Sulfuricurvum sp.]